MLSIKLTEPLLLAPLLLLAVRGRACCNWAVWCALAMLLFSLNAKVQIGVRLVLPLVALGVVGMSAAAVNARQSFASGWRRRAVVARLRRRRSLVRDRFAGASGRTVCVTSTDFWGDPADGDRLVSDANWDWGQGLKELARWQRRQGSEPLDVWYFGADPALSRLPMRSLRLQDLPLEKPEDVAPYVQGPARGGQHDADPRLPDLRRRASRRSRRARIPGDATARGANQHISDLRFHFTWRAGSRQRPEFRAVAETNSGADATRLAKHQ